MWLALWYSKLVAVLEGPGLVVVAVDSPVVVAAAAGTPREDPSTSGVRRAAACAHYVYDIIALRWLTGGWLGILGGVDGCWLWGGGVLTSVDIWPVCACFFFVVNTCSTDNTRFTNGCLLLVGLQYTAADVRTSLTAVLKACSWA